MSIFHKSFYQNFVSLSKYIFKNTFVTYDKNPLNAPIVFRGEMVECGLTWTLMIGGLQYTVKP